MNADTPPTRPLKKKPKKAAKKAAKTAPKARKRKRKRRSSEGSNVVPPLMPAGSVKKLWYWLGAFPSLPRSFVTIGGQTFCKYHETVYDREHGGRSERHPHLGQCLELTKTQVEQIALHARHGIIRFLEPPRDEDFEGCGYESIRSGKARLGHPIRIPREDELKARGKNDLPANRYDPQEFDEPIAWHIYAVLCTNQEHPRCEDIFPDPLSETDIRWPSEAAA